MERAMFIAILTIGLLGATASAGLAQLAISFKGKNALIECIACATVFVPSLVMTLFAVTRLFNNSMDLFIMAALISVPLCMIVNFAKVKGLSLREQLM